MQFSSFVKQAFEYVGKQAGWPFWFFEKIVFKLFEMWFVYFLQSVDQDFLYIGHTNDVYKRLQQHNEGLNQSTKHYAPFELAGYVAVKTEQKAIQLEKYFKTGSGKAVLKKRIIGELQKLSI